MQMRNEYRGHGRSTNEYMSVRITVVGELKFNKWRLFYTTIQGYTKPRIDKIYE